MIPNTYYDYEAVVAGTLLDSVMEAVVSYCYAQNMGVDTASIGATGGASNEDGIITLLLTIYLDSERHSTSQTFISQLRRTLAAVSYDMFLERGITVRFDIAVDDESMRDDVLAHWDFDGEDE